jgi:transposase InsO family protein
MRRAWTALEAAALEAGHAPLAPEVWETRMPDGSVLAVVRTQQEAHALARDGRETEGLGPGRSGPRHLRPERPNHVWSYDFVEDRTHDGRKFRMLNVIDEFTHECLAIRVGAQARATDVIDVLSDLFILRGVPAHIRSDNGPEFVAKAVQGWIAAVGAKTAYIAPGSPWENGYVESFNARLRDELLKGENLLLASGGPGRDRKLAAALQHHPSTRVARLQATRTGGDPTGLRRLARGATPTGLADLADRGAQTDAELTFAADHPMGADHASRSGAPAATRPRPRPPSAAGPAAAAPPAPRSARPAPRPAPAPG